MSLVNNPRNCAASSLLLAYLKRMDISLLFLEIKELTSVTVGGVSSFLCLRGPAGIIGSKTEHFQFLRQCRGLYSTTGTACYLHPSSGPKIHFVQKFHPSSDLNIHLHHFIRTQHTPSSFHPNPTYTSSGFLHPSSDSKYTFIISSELNIHFIQKASS